MRYVNSIRDVDSAEAERQYKEYVKDIALSMFETSLKELNTDHNPGKQLDGKGNPVSAINQLVLSAAALKNGFTDQRWVTFKQLQELGGRLPRGTHGTKIVSWQWKKTITTTDENGEKSSKEVWLEKPIKKTAVVFNLSQCQLSSEILAKLDDPKQQFQQSSADAYIQNNQMPAREQSEDPAVYYHNAFSTVASGSIYAELPSGVAPIHTDLATRFIEDAFNFNSSDADLNIVDSIRNYDEQLAAEGLSDAERAVRIVDQISEGIIQANKVSNHVRSFISQPTPQQPVQQVTAAVISAEEQKKYISNEGKAVSGLVENSETVTNQYQYSDDQEQVAEQAQQPTVAPQLHESKNATEDEIQTTQEKGPNAPDQTLQDALKLQQEQLQKQFAEATKQQQAQIQSMETRREEPPQVQVHPAENSEIQTSGQQNVINDISTEQSQNEASPSIASDTENKKFNLSDSDNYIKLVSFLAVKDFERKNMVKPTFRS